MSWWIWIVFGISLLVLELLIPSGFFIFFFGVGAFIIGVALSLGLEISPYYQWINCIILSLGLLLISRRFLMGKWASPKSFSSNPEGREVLVTAIAEAGSDGSCEYRGTNWNIRNLGDTPLGVGDKAVVEGREGLILLVRKI
jgi:membrane protein implicated in regulation of membrane protease activity